MLGKTFKYNWILFVSLVISAIFNLGYAGDSDDPRLKIVASFFPIEQFTRNVVEGAPGIEVRSILPPSYGCPHSYYLTPRDMKTIAWGDALVINGLGMEEFSAKSIANSNPRLKVIDSSHGIEAVSLDEHGHGHHHHSEMNPHLFASPREAAAQVRNIARELSALDPEFASIYMKNSDAFAARLEKIADDFVEVVSKSGNRKVLTVHAVFDYLTRDTGLEIIGTIESEPGQEPSAGRMLDMVRLCKRENPAAIFVEPQYPAKSSEAIGKEAGIPVYTLDPVANGPENAPLDYYEKVMIKNLETLKEALAVEKN